MEWPCGLMTVAEAGASEGLRSRVASEEPGKGEDAAKVEFVPRRGLIHLESGATQVGLDVEIEEEDQQPARAGHLPWPPSLLERVRAVRDYLMQAHAPVQPGAVARGFTRAARVPEIKAIPEWRAVAAYLEGAACSCASRYSTALRLACTRTMLALALL